MESVSWAEECDRVTDTGCSGVGFAWTDDACAGPEEREMKMHRWA